MLNKLEIARLAAKLKVPDLACEVITMHKTIEADAHYALHDALADMQADEALLSIAIIARHIAESSTESSAGKNVLSLECERIINEYGPLWLYHQQSGKTDNSYLIGLLENIPEDLETLAELIDINLCDGGEARNIAEICDILIIQAGAHAIIAEEFLNVMNAQDIAAPSSTSSPKTGHFIAPAAIETNVIAFPGC